jgi:hypothetical protein
MAQEWLKAGCPFKFISGMLEVPARKRIGIGSRPGVLHHADIPKSNHQLQRSSLLKKRPGSIAAASSVLQRQMLLRAREIFFGFSRKEQNYDCSFTTDNGWWDRYSSLSG